ncbi:MAG TPA: glycosyltransferase family 39 protein [Vicinamibacterales bacterium]|nr:glycosyltransferase family 39 protein [Vicinamibacterales bacterium]
MLDVLAAIFAIAALSSFVVGGVRFELIGLRVSIGTPLRPIIFTAVVMAIRHWLISYKPAIARILKAGGDPLPMDEARLFPAANETFWRRAGGVLLLVIGYSVLVAIATWPQAAELHNVSDKGDPLFSIWRLMWLLHEFPRHPLNIFNANEFYPEPRTLTYSDPVLFPAVLAAPLSFLGLHRVVVYNLVFLSGGVLSGVTTYILVRALTGRRDAAWIAGAIYAVYPYRVEHLAHLELQMTMWMPIALLFVHRAMASGSLRDGILAGVAWAAQMLSALYYGSFLMPCMFTLGLVLWMARSFPMRPLRGLAAGAVVAAILFAPVASQYLKTRPYMGPRPLGAVQYYSAVPGDYLNAYGRSWTYQSWSKRAIGERALFPRITPVVLSAVALWPPLSAARIGYALCFAFTFDASLGYNGRTFPTLYENIPPFSGIRVPARFSVVVGLMLAVLSGFGAARILRRWPRVAPVLTVLATAVIIYEALPNISLESVWLEPPPVYEPLIGQPEGVLAEFPMPSDVTQAFAEFNYVYFSTFHWQKLVNGQSGWLPPTYEELLRQERTFPSDEAIAYLKTRGVDYVTVHGAFYDPNQYKEVTRVLDARPDFSLVTKVEWEGRESRLYRLSK